MKNKYFGFILIAAIGVLSFGIHISETNASPGCEVQAKRMSCYNSNYEIVAYGSNCVRGTNCICIANPCPDINEY